MKIETYLEGADLRSIGRSNDLVKLVRTQADFDRLFDFLFHSDRLKVMRAADSIEKITVKHPSYLKPHYKKLLALSSVAENKELKWHLAQLLPRMEMNNRERAGAWKILFNWASSPLESRIVRVNALEGLACLSVARQQDQEKFNQLLEKISKENIPSLNARIRKLKKPSNKT